MYKMAKWFIKDKIIGWARKVKTAGGNVMKKIISYLLIVSMLFSLVGTGICNKTKEEAKAASSYTVTEEDLFYKCPNI